MSGSPELNIQTPAAAKMTETFDAMSFREHSNTELIFMSSSRWRQRRNRHKPLATNPAILKILIISYEGSTGLTSLCIIWAITKLAAMKINPPLNSATRAFMTGPLDTANKLKLYVRASPRLSKLSESNAVDLP